MKSLEIAHKSRPRLPRHWAAIGVCAFANLVGGCSCDKEKSPEGAPSATSPAPSASVAVNALPVDPAVVQKAVNPKGRKPYSGPTGTVSGQVTVSGPEAPLDSERVASIDKPACEPAKKFYERQFREGMMRSLADALVTVTGYDAYVPAHGDAVSVTARDCHFGTRTVAATFGQRLDVFAKGSQPYMPKLVGTRQRAVRVALPGGDAIKLYPPRPGRYLLADEMHRSMAAEVFVLQYSTFDVTGLDGQYEIRGVPVGEVKVSALLPAAQAVSEKTVKVIEGEVTKVDLVIELRAPEDAGKKETIDSKIH